MKPVVAIVGRPNVGKSALFNRILGRRQAVVEDVVGVTRDRLYAETEWQGRSFVLVDTGGLGLEGEGTLAEQVQRQARSAIAEADVLLLVVDAAAGVTPLDEDVAGFLRKQNKPVILVANKGESPRAALEAYQFFQLGLGPALAVSAIHGLGIGDLLDEVVRRLPDDTGFAEEVSEPVRAALVGRPNAGKSSLLNALVGRDRVIVSEMPGTTRDAVDVMWERDGTRILFVDTPGMRRRTRVRQPLDRHSLLRAERAIERSAVVLLVMDAIEGVAEQEKKIAGRVIEAGRVLVLLVNKWDLVREREEAARVYTRALRAELYFADFAPVLFVSALTGYGVGAIPDAILEAASRYRSRIPTNRLNLLISEAQAVHPPPARGKKRLKIYYATQVSTAPPCLLLFVNDPELMTEGYRRYLESRLRQEIPLAGVPVRISLRRRSRSKGGEEPATLE